MTKTIRPLAAGIFLATCIGMVPATTLAAKPDERAEALKPIEKIFEAPGHTKDEIYVASKIWIAESFRSAKAVIEYDNKDEGTIIGNGIIPYPCKGFECLAKSDWKVRFTIRIDVKDDKFRLTFSNLNLTWPPSYNGGIVVAGHDGPIYREKDRDKVSVALFDLGPQLAATIGQAKAKDDW